MSISTQINSLIHKVFKESTVTSGQPGVVVLNSDGSKVDIGALSAADDTVTTTPNHTTIGNGHKEVTTAGTAVALASSTSCKRVTIQAYRANTGFIIVGGTGVNGSSSIGTGTGASLAAGESISFDINNLATIFIDSTVNGEGVRYIYLN